MELPHGGNSNPQKNESEVMFMKKLADMVKIAENNMECVVLEVTGSMMGLISLGCFNGDEKLIRLTKGGNHTCTVWSADNNHFSWWWGIGGCTCVSDSVSKKGKLIQECITKDFEIVIEGNAEQIASTLYIKSLADIAHAQHDIKLMYWGNPNREIVCHRDGVFFTKFTSVAAALQHFEDHGYAVTANGSYIAQSGCNVEEYHIERR